MPQFDYDLFVIGGGSGGVRSGRLAAAMGKKVAIAEEFRYGGTCVIRGCVPKKLYVYASQFHEHFEDAAGFGWHVGESRFDWTALVAAKEKEIGRLEGLYRKGLDNAGATILDTRAVLEGPNTVRLTATGETVTAERIVIAVGGHPTPHPGLPGHALCISSNEAFDLPELPKSILIAGGGYIAVEFANIFHGLGVETTLIYRGKEILGRFDMDLRRMLHETMEKKGIRIICHEIFAAIERREDGRLDGHGREPGAVPAAADDDLRDHQRGVAGLVGERERAEADGAGARLTDVVLDVGARDGLRPPLHRVAEAGRPRSVEAGGDAPPDQALAAAQPADRILPGQQVEEGEIRQVHRDGAHREGR